MRENLRQQLIELTNVHKGLTPVEQDHAVVVSGVLPFEASADRLETIRDSFEIELTIPRDFPDTLPQVRETGGRIEVEYEHRYTSGTLCLAVPVEERRVFSEQPTLLGFVNRLVIPYFYGYRFWKTHGYHPFDEAAHGPEGILHHYMDTLRLPSEVSALAVICFLFEHGYRGHHDCPCGGGLRVRACHGPALLALYRNHTHQTLRSDFLSILKLCVAKFQKDQLSIPKRLRLQLVRLLDRVKN